MKSQHVHINHLEDEVFLGGRSISTHLLHGKLSTKIDGSPSITYGRINGDFFVSTKSFFNKDPKVNFSIDDIHRNHGGTPGLPEKLVLSFEHLQKITPNFDCVLQGDYLFSSNDLHVIDGMTCFTPNTLTVGVDSSIHANLGFSPHSKFINGIRYTISTDDIIIDPSVWIMSVDAPDISDKFNSRIKSIGTFSGEASKHFIDLVAYVNRTIRIGTIPSGKDFHSHMKLNLSEAIAKLKLKSAKTRRIDKFNELMDDIPTTNAIELFELHGEISSLKDEIIADLDSRHQFKFFLDGLPSNPEGYVITSPLGAVKLVNRRTFSHLNFLYHARSDNSSRSV